MKGFIEVTERDSGYKKLLSTNSILSVVNVKPVLLTTSEIICCYDGNTSFTIIITESYEQIKELIKQAQQTTVEVKRASNNNNDEKLGNITPLDSLILSVI